MFSRHTLPKPRCGVGGVCDGAEAVEAVRRERYDVVLMDLSMPVMGGLEMMDKVKETDPEAILIVITGFATIETAVEAMKHGAYDYVPKPFTPDQLVAVSAEPVGGDLEGPGGLAAQPQGGLAGWRGPGGQGAGEVAGHLHLDVQVTPDAGRHTGVNRRSWASALFAFVGHLQADPRVNLLVRLPAGIALGLLYLRTRSLEELSARLGEAVRLDTAVTPP